MRALPAAAAWPMVLLLAATAACDSDPPYGSSGKRLLADVMINALFSADGRTLVYQNARGSAERAPGIFAFEFADGRPRQISPCCWGTSRLAGWPEHGFVYAPFLEMTMTMGRTGRGPTYRLDRLWVDGTTAPSTAATGVVDFAVAPGGRLVWSTQDGTLTVHDQDPTGMDRTFSGCAPFVISPDGARVLCREGHVLDLGDGSTVPIKPADPLVRPGMVDNPDLIHWDDSGLWRVETEAGGAAALVNLLTGETRVPDRRPPGKYRFSTATFSADGATLFFTMSTCVGELRPEVGCPRSEVRIELRSVPTAGGESTLLRRDSVERRFYPFPDGKALLLSSYDEGTTVLTLGR
jgi:hypothetical protein